MCDIPCILVYDCNNFTNTCTIVHNCACVGEIITIILQSDPLSFEIFIGIKVGHANFAHKQCCYKNEAEGFLDFRLLQVYEEPRM
jgi:hypothetical protein